MDSGEGRSSPTPHFPVWRLGVASSHFQLTDLMVFNSSGFENYAILPKSLKTLTIPKGTVQFLKEEKKKQKQNRLLKEDHTKSEIN